MQSFNFRSLVRSCSPRLGLSHCVWAPKMEDLELLYFLIHRTMATIITSMLQIDGQIDNTALHFVHDAVITPSSDVTLSLCMMQAAADCVNVLQPMVVWFWASPFVCKPHFLDQLPSLSVSHLVFIISCLLNSLFLFTQGTKLACSTNHRYVIHFCTRQSDFSDHLTLSVLFVFVNYHCIELNCMKATLW